MKIMYAITKISKDGLRCIMGSNQGRNFHDTREKAEARLSATMASNSPELLAELGRDYRVDALVCYDHGDAIGIYVTEKVLDDQTLKHMVKWINGCVPAYHRESDGYVSPAGMAHRFLDMIHDDGIKVEDIYWPKLRDRALLMYK